MNALTPNREQNLLSTTIERLRCCCQVNGIASWRCGEEAVGFELLNCPLVELDPREYVAWAAGERVLWLAQTFVVPENLHGYPLENLSLRLKLTWWAQTAEIFVNGCLVGQGDLFDSTLRVLLSRKVKNGDEFNVALRLVSPAHDAGALMQSLWIFESEDQNLDPGFMADELAVLQHYLESEPEKLEAASRVVARINWLALPDRQKFEASLGAVRLTLAELGAGLKQHSIKLLGHAHLDLAWLWSFSETWDVAQRTFASVLQLQSEFPELIFCHSTPALYAWIEANCPDLFAKIQQRVRAGQWEVVGGLWVEPDLNLIDGESIVRQILYAQRYVLEKFGQISTVAWLPDSFGFCATLPQFLKLGGIEFFVTQKLRWNDTTEFPYGAFWWRSPDGTELFSLMSAPIGEGIEPEKMAAAMKQWERQTGIPDYLWLPGVGDHGGGPTRDMLEIGQRWQQSCLFPRLEFTTASSYLQQLQTAAASFPVWQDELYLEFHRGCYTTHAKQKALNRRCEGLLYQAELFATLASIATGVDYPQAELETAWKQVLINQFHDILPGSGIPQVYVDANQAWQEVEQVGTQILQQSLRRIAAQVALPLPPQPDAMPIFIFNPLNWQRSEVVAVSLPSSGKYWQIYDLAGNQLPVQLSKAKLLFLAEDIPPIGYRVFWLCQGQHREIQVGTATNNWILENEFLRVMVDITTGDLSSVFDKTNHREVLQPSGGNHIQAFRDCGQYWDAWNIDPNYAQYPLPATELKSIEWIECGKIQSRLRVVRQLGQSEFCQDYILQIGSPVLKIVTTVNWQERQVLVKAAFPLNLEADYATYEIPCGAIHRSTKPQTPSEQAKWELPALRWADMSTGNYGVSLLNNCKYGYDAQPQQLRLTLLRSPNWPDPEADRGFHEFTYALYPHAGSWQAAHTVRRGYELNLPLQVLQCDFFNHPTTGNLTPTSYLLDLSAPNLILIAFKRSENDTKQWILRCYECHGQAANLALDTDLKLSLGHSVDLLEQPAQATAPSTDGNFQITPWQIASFTVQSS